jgi:5-hydroxyisourate hydrolase
MASLSTHVLDASEGGPLPRVRVTVHDEAGQLVASATTGADGRAPALATDLPLARYRITWDTGGTFFATVSVTVALTDERHYHVPLLAAPASAVAYLGV